MKFSTILSSVAVWPFSAAGFICPRYKWHCYLSCIFRNLIAEALLHSMDFCFFVLICSNGLVQGCICPFCLCHTSRVWIQIAYWMQKILLASWVIVPLLEKAHRYSSALLHMPQSSALAFQIGCWAEVRLWINPDHRSMSREEES